MAEKDNWDKKHKCPVCGKYEFEMHNDFDICEVCHWENDGIQELNPDYKGGANIMSLNQMRKAYKMGMSYDDAEEASLNGEL